MQAQIASILSSDDDADSKNVSKALELLGDEFQELDIQVEEEQETAEQPEAEETPTPAEEEKPAEEKKESGPSKAERKKAVLVKKIKEWYAAGYDVSGLYKLVDGDLETFKKAAKEMLMKGKVR